MQAITCQRCKDTRSYPPDDNKQKPCPKCNGTGEWTPETAEELWSVVHESPTADTKAIVIDALHELLGKIQLHQVCWDEIKKCQEILDVGYLKPSGYLKHSGMVVQGIKDLQYELEDEQESNQELRREIKDLKKDKKKLQKESEASMAKLITCIEAVRKIKKKISLISIPPSGFPDWDKWCDMIYDTLKEVSDDVEPCLVQKLMDAVAVRTECRKAYNEWYDDYNSKPRPSCGKVLQKAHNMEGSLRTNLCMAETKIVELGVEIATQFPGWNEEI